jgi:hypothetical protein
MTSADAPGWLPDPEGDDQERYWNGSAWTDRVRPVGNAGSPSVPEHAPDLHRALAAATADIEAVEDRLSRMFERTDDAGGRGAADRGVSVDVTPAGGRGAGGGAGGGADFAELDAALAAEEADQPDESGSGPDKGTAKRRMFRRRAKGSTPAPG